jgi:hypothetical protein
MKQHGSKAAKHELNYLLIVQQIELIRAAIIKKND